MHLASTPNPIPHTESIATTAPQRSVAPAMPLVPMQVSVSPREHRHFPTADNTNKQ